jgi:hypothetical protein
VAGLLTLFLGTNVWVALVLTPALTSGVMARHPSVGVLAPLPILVLVLGIWRRAPLVLLLAYPAALLLPVAVDARVAAALATGPFTLPLAAIGLVGYLLGASALSGAGLAFPAPARARRLGGSLGAEAPARWRRRRRIYLALIGLSALFPAVLLYGAALSPHTRAYLSESYPDGRAAGMTALFLVGALALWGFLFATAFVGPLRRHRTGDKELVAELDRLRLDARQATPRLGFYVGVVVALALMALLVSMRMGS